MNDKERMRADEEAYRADVFASIKDLLAELVFEGEDLDVMLANIKEDATAIINFQAEADYLGEV